MKVLADSTCDLSQELLTQYNIDLIPLTITLEGVDYKDRLDITTDEFFTRTLGNDNVATTGAPSPTLYQQYFKNAVDEGHKEILCICMSHGTSASYQSGELGRQQFLDEHPDSDIEIHVVDSLCMSHGSGYLVLKAAQMNEKGAMFDEIVNYIEAYKIKVKHYLSVDDLNHLIRSGRISAASALVGKLLNIKPIMTMKNAKGAVTAKERGRNRVLNYYVQQFMARKDPKQTSYIIIGYTTDREVAVELENRLRANTSFDGTIYIMQMGVAVATHVGPGGISMFFLEK